MKLTLITFLVIVVIADAAWGATPPPTSENIDLAMAYMMKGRNLTGVSQVPLKGPPISFAQFYSKLKPITDQMASTSRAMTRVSMNSANYAEGSSLAKENDETHSKLILEYAAQEKQASALVKATLANQKDDTEFLSKYLEFVKKLKGALAEELEGQRHGSYDVKAAMAVEQRETQAKALEELESGFEESGISKWPTRFRDMGTFVTAGYTTLKVGVRMSAATTGSAIATGAEYVVAVGESSTPIAIAFMEVEGAYEIGDMLLNPKHNPAQGMMHAFSSTKALTTQSDEYTKARQLQMQKSWAAAGLYDTTPKIAGK